MKILGYTVSTILKTKPLMFWIDANDPAVDEGVFEKADIDFEAFV